MGRSTSDEGTASAARRRCPWAGSTPAMIAYHDREWGVPLHDDRGLFEFLILEGAQAGLSWSTILGRREGYQRALHGFDAARIARYGARDVARLLADPGIIRNRLKVAATIVNARCSMSLPRITLAICGSARCRASLVSRCHSAASCSFQPRNPK